MTQLATTDALTGYFILLKLQILFTDLFNERKPVIYEELKDTHHKKVEIDRNKLDKEIGYI